MSFIRFERERKASFNFAPTFKVNTNTNTRTHTTRCWQLILREITAQIMTQTTMTPKDDDDDDAAGDENEISSLSPTLICRHARSCSCYCFCATFYLHHLSHSAVLSWFQSESMVYSRRVVVN